MGRWRGRGAAACALGALALAAGGCGVEEHANLSRPQPPTRVSVAVNSDGVTVQPPRIAIGPEPTQQIPQNEHAGQPPVRSNAPLNVTIVAANLTDRDSRLVLHGVRKDVASEPLVANGNVLLHAALPTGTYKISLEGIPAAPATLVVGPYRSSSQNDILLP
jgi:hypothetical protein